MSAETLGNERVHVWLRGRVQGVGFRAHVEYYALQFAVSGWVRNVGEDSVEVTAEGKRETLKLFVAMVQKGPRMAQVDESTVEWESATNDFQGFTVKPKM